MVGNQKIKEREREPVGVLAYLYYWEGLSCDNPQKWEDCCATMYHSAVVCRATNKWSDGPDTVICQRVGGLRLMGLSDDKPHSESSLSYYKLF